MVNQIMTYHKIIRCFVGFISRETGCAEFLTSWNHFSGHAEDVRVTVFYVHHFIYCLNDPYNNHLHWNTTVVP